MSARSVRTESRPASTGIGGPFAGLGARSPSCSCRRPVLLTTSGSTTSASTAARRWSPSASASPGDAAACSSWGKGVFFGLGAYAMGMHLKLEAAGPGGVPDFMLLYDPRPRCRPGGSPSAAAPSRSSRSWSLPAAVASVLGLAIFKRRIKGAYFAILSQALAVALRHADHRHDQVHRRRHRPERLHVVLRLRPVRPGRTSG